VGYRNLVNAYERAEVGSGGVISTERAAIEAEDLTSEVAS
jgi:hypothetical protein